MKIAHLFVAVLVLTAAMSHAGPPIVSPQQPTISPNVRPETPLPVKPVLPSTTAPIAVSALCASSKSFNWSVTNPDGTMAVIYGKGCRETRPAVWASHSCTRAMGCCIDPGGCLVPSSTNSVRGDGLY